MRMNKDWFDTDRVRTNARGEEYVIVKHEDVHHVVFALFMITFFGYLLFAIATFVTPSKTEIDTYRQNCSVMAMKHEWFIARNPGDGAFVFGEPMMCNIVAPDATVQKRL